MDASTIPTDFNISLISDIIIVAIMLISAGVAFFRGLIREVLTLAGVIGGVFVALIFGDNLIPTMEGWLGVGESEEPKELFGLIPYEFLAAVLAYGAVFLAFVIALSILSHFLSKAASAIGLGPIDRTLGILFGLARGLLLLAILYMPLYLTFSDEAKEEWFGNSKLIPYIEMTSAEISSYFTDGEEKYDTSKATSKILDKFDILKKIDPSEEPTPSENLSEDILLESTEDGYKENERDKLESLIEDSKPQVEQKEGENPGQIDFNQ